jgi:DNA-binding MurR/RpiR family transcriptional regulator
MADLSRAKAIKAKAKREAVRQIVAQIARGRLTVTEAAEGLGVSRMTIYRRCKALGVDPAEARAAHLRRLLKLLPAYNRRLVREAARRPDRPRQSVR